jgi:hypothetical protein
LVLKLVVREAFNSGYPDKEVEIRTAEHWPVTEFEGTGNKYL